MEAAAPTKRFTVARTIDGFEVVDTDGRPVAWRSTERQAKSAATKMNNAAEGGSIMGALGGGIRTSSVE